MKKLLSVLFIVPLLFSIAIAETDLSSLTYDELISLIEAITAEIVSRPEWKQVTVPVGQFEVGKDIPAGEYSVTTNASISGITVWGASVKDYSTNGGMIYTNVVKPDEPISKLSLETGWVVEIIYDPVIFSPPTSLEF